MNHLLIIIYGYILIAIILILIVWRDYHKPNLILNKHKIFAKFTIFILSISIFIALYTNLLEPYWLKTKYIKLSNPQLNNIKIAYIADLQVGRWKKDAWVNKITDIIYYQQPDLVLIGGDMVDNAIFNEYESEYLQPLIKLSDNFPTYYVMGNHEYGIGGKTKNNPAKFSGDQSMMVMEKMKSLNILLLKDELDCLIINNQDLCLYGIDDIWKSEPMFQKLNHWNEITPLIYLTHNPDGILYYPVNKPKPILTLAGHTHAGQIYLPIIGPLGNAQIDLGKLYYYGLKTYNNFLMYITSGVGESGAPLRFLARPEIVIIEY